MVGKWNGENTVVIRHEQEERAAARREQGEQEPPKCAKCGEAGLIVIEGMKFCRACGSHWRPAC